MLLSSGKRTGQADGKKCQLLDDSLKKTVKKEKKMVLEGCLGGSVESWREAFIKVGIADFEDAGISRVLGDYTF